MKGKKKNPEEEKKSADDSEIKSEHAETDPAQNENEDIQNT